MINIHKHVCHTSQNTRVMYTYIFTYWTNAASVWSFGRIITCIIVLLPNSNIVNNNNNNTSNRAYYARACESEVNKYENNSARSLSQQIKSRIYRSFLHIRIKCIDWLIRLWRLYMYVHGDLNCTDLLRKSYFERNNAYLACICISFIVLIYFNAWIYLV